MHRHNRPCDHPAAGHPQILPCRQLDLRGSIQKLLLHSIVILLPPVVGERCYIVENEAIVLRIELRRSLRRSRAPRRTQTVDQLAKRGVIRCFLLCPRPYKRQQCANKSKRNVHQPAPPLSILADSSTHEIGPSGSPGNSRTRVRRQMSQRVPPKLVRIRSICKPSYEAGLNQLTGGRYCPSEARRLPVNCHSWPNPGCIPLAGPLFSLWGK